VRVVISGAGIGGLTLAQALRDECEVVVLERDAEAVQTGGYRLAITPAATAVLERELRPELMHRIRAVSDGTDRFAQFTVASSSLRPILIGSEPPGADRLLAQRRALRLLLTDGIADRIRWSSRVERVQQEVDEAVVTLTDGTELRADLVVGAEGASSPTVRAATPLPTTVDLGLTGIAGSAPRRAGMPVPRYLTRGPALAFGADGLGVFLSLTSTGSGPMTPQLHRAVGSPSLVWGLIAPAELLPGAVHRSAAELIDAAQRSLRGWHPWLIDRIGESDPDRVAAFAFRAADPDADLTPWRPGRITALGDAIHAMPPTGGQAASTAIRDAGSLATHLREHLRGRVALGDALAAYHRELTSWARPAVRESLGPVRVIRALRHPALQAVARPLLALADALPAVRT
jgi:salicylate hydroxylase